MSRDGAVRIAELQRRLANIEASEPLAMEWFPDALREITGCDSVASYSYRCDEERIALDAVHASGWPMPLARVRAEMNRWMQTHRRVQGCYDAQRPEPWQRGRVITNAAPQQIMRSGFPPQYRDRLPPLTEQIVEGQRLIGGDRPTSRVLVCDGASLLAFVGLFNETQIAPRQTAVLRSLVPGLTRRLRLERALAEVEIYKIGLEAAIEHLPTAAFLISRHGAILVSNALGRGLLRDRGIVAALKGVRGPDKAYFDVTPLRTGATTHFLAVRRQQIGTGQHRLVMCARRWNLTPRETEVAEWLLRGATNRAIADELDCAEGTVEIHVSRILRKADAETRAAFVALVYSSG